MGKMSKALANQAYLEGFEDHKIGRPLHEHRWKNTAWEGHYQSGMSAVPCYINPLSKEKASLLSQKKVLRDE